MESTINQFRNNGSYNMPVMRMLLIAAMSFENTDFKQIYAMCPLISVVYQSS